MPALLNSPPIPLVVSDSDQRTVMGQLKLICHTCKATQDFHTSWSGHVDIMCLRVGWINFNFLKLFENFQTYRKVASVAQRSPLYHSPRCTHLSIILCDYLLSHLRVSCRVLLSLVQNPVEEQALRLAVVNLQSHFIRKSYF